MTSPTSRLVLTGERLGRRHLVKVDQKPIWLPGGLFLTLCSLVRSRCTTQTGFIVESPLTIFRLRGCVDTDSAKRKGLSMIQTGDGHEYRLAFDCAAVDIELSFAELPSPAFISRNDKDVLLNMHVSNVLV